MAMEEKTQSDNEETTTPTNGPSEQDITERIVGVKELKRWEFSTKVRTGVRNKRCKKHQSLYEEKLRSAAKSELQHQEKPESESPKKPASPEKPQQSAEAKPELEDKPECSKNVQEKIKPQIQKKLQLPSPKKLQIPPQSRKKSQLQKKLLPSGEQKGGNPEQMEDDPPFMLSPEFIEAILGAGGAFTGISHEKCDAIVDKWDGEEDKTYDVDEIMDEVRSDADKAMPDEIKREVMTAIRQAILQMCVDTGVADT
ncbi:hypothetical protein QR680_016443 [Steinernema hermaphroditum]|uniref:Uncharacterized protein n=1 Tax=Steinernema hermaphroditum TaxID=289476 RepID=A0AA39HB86_9BILA|nr:hypothetical protein QR680_016443 [Steinernema hermaphroditum]